MGGTPLASSRSQRIPPWMLPANGPPKNMLLAGLFDASLPRLKSAEM